MEIISFIVTIIVGLFAEVIFSDWLNWSNAGIIFAVATMGTIILWNTRHKK